MRDGGIAEKRLSSVKPEQLEVVSAFLKGDVFVILYGKSACFQRLLSVLLAHKNHHISLSLLKQGIAGSLQATQVSGVKEAIQAQILR